MAILGGAGLAAAYTFIRFGPAILRVAKEATKKWVKQGGKEIKNPTLKQKKKSIVPSQLGKEVKKSKSSTKSKQGGKSSDRAYVKERYDPLDPSKDIGFGEPEDVETPSARHKMIGGRKAPIHGNVSSWRASGGSVKKKNYAYGGRVAKYSKEKS